MLFRNYSAETLWVTNDEETKRTRLAIQFNTQLLSIPLSYPYA